MLIRLMFPYILLFLIVVVYLYVRRLQLGSVLLKVNRALFSRYNADSFMLIIVITAVSYFLSRFDLQDIPAAAESMILGPYTYAYFYGALVLTVILREIEKPALREKGISTSRGFWKWDEILSYRWSKNTVTLSISRGKKKRSEIWQVNGADKKELDSLLKKMVPKRTGRSKRKK